MITDDYMVVSKPNSSLSTKERVKVLWLLAIVPAFVAVGFAFQGVWIIFPFVGIELLALCYAFYYIDYHASDYESITIEGDRLVVVKHNKKQTIQFVLNTYWAKLVLNKKSRNLYMYLRSQGKDLEIGRFMNEDQRDILAEQLKKRISVTYTK